ncbi:DNA polymerase III subunit [Longimicrobium sp.]|uniref:DNA polymerase III subunit n=1 Tax=Longimicrobium sp. TaxID=2029185 RepID=UPI002E2EAE1A|nr:DNA polymerase III subunit [Longimicrobium sp.]HEX6041776.1 DNA polymerase III subunit [Longimicrobium sp.]
MPLPPVYGHADARAMLASAARAGNLSQSLLVHGPAGIGKERMAMWLAQRVMCEAPRADGPCGQCRSCRSIDRLEHPDVHWFFPLPRPDAATPEKLRDKLEEARGVELEARRANPHHVPQFDKAPAYFMGTIQNLQRLAGMRPAVGSRKVFVVGDAEAMVPQESSQEAANAFLKLLEEPPADTTLILTSSNPGALLPTIKSRVLPIRLLRLTADEVRDFLVRELKMADGEAASLAAVSEGAIGRALRLAPAGGNAGTLQRQRETGRELLQAALADSEAARFAAANAVAPSGARGEFTGTLESLALWLRDLMAIAAGAPDTVAYAGADEALLRRLASRPGLRAEGVARAILHVQEAQEMAGGNVNPQLILSDLLRSVRRALS